MSLYTFTLLAMVSLTTARGASDNIVGDTAITTDSTSETTRPVTQASWNYQDFPIPKTDNTSYLCNVPVGFSSTPHICDPLGFLNDTLYYEIEDEIKKLHDYVPPGNNRECPGWQVTIGLMKWLKEDDYGGNDIARYVIPCIECKSVLRLKSEFQEFGQRLLDEKWKFLEHCITDVVTVAMSTYAHGEIPIHCRQNILGEHGYLDNDILYPDTVGKALKNILYRLIEVQHEKDDASICHRSWFLIHRAAIVAGFTICLLFIVILWVAYCITGKCGTCAGEGAGSRSHLK